MSGSRTTVKLRLAMSRSRMIGQRNRAGRICHRKSLTGSGFGGSSENDATVEEGDRHERHRITVLEKRGVEAVVSAFERFSNVSTLDLASHWLTGNIGARAVCVRCRICPLEALLPR